MKITCIQTGGTIDKDYPQGATDHGYEFSIGEPAILSVLTKVKPYFEIEMICHMQKDSLDITEEDRQSIHDLVVSLPNDKIIITHGTDTIGLTAEALSTIANKTIVLTGAMLPEKFTDSDAMFNIGMAIGGAQMLPHGVYIALFGELQPWDTYADSTKTV